jgi:hypothetical protein
MLRRGRGCRIMMRSAIGKLEERLWNTCIAQIAARDDETETVKKWQEDDYIHMKERFRVRPMSPEIIPLVHQALQEWREIERMFCARLGTSPNEFLREFVTIRATFLNGDPKWLKLFGNKGSIAHGAVMNMDWVNMFGWILPQAYPGKSDELLRIGRIVTAIFYCEMLHKYGSEANALQNNNLAQMEARWRLADDLSRSLTGIEQPVILTHKENFMC